MVSYPREVGAAFIDSLPRSRDFGSPQCRLRLYVVGAREDVVSWSSFRSMIQYIQTFLPSLHPVVSIKEVIDWVGDICDESGPSMICGLEKAWNAVC